MKCRNFSEFVHNRVGSNLPTRYESRGHAEYMATIKLSVDWALLPLTVRGEFCIGKKAAKNSACKAAVEAGYFDTTGVEIIEERKTDIHRPAAILRTSAVELTGPTEENLLPPIVVSTKEPAFGCLEEPSVVSAEFADSFEPAVVKVKANGQSELLVSERKSRTRRNLRFIEHSHFGSCSQLMIFQARKRAVSPQNSSSRCDSSSSEDEDQHQLDAFYHHGKTTMVMERKDARRELFYGSSSKKNEPEPQPVVVVPETPEKTTVVVPGKPTCMLTRTPPVRRLIYPQTLVYPQPDHMIWFK